MRASASSRTSPAANLYASQAKANANKPDPASPFALLLEATAPSQSAKPSKKDTQDSGDNSDNKFTANQNDTSNDSSATDQAAQQTQYRSPARPDKSDKRQDNSSANGPDDTADNSQTPVIDPGLADQQQAVAAASAAQPQPVAPPPAPDDGDDVEILAAADAANAPTRTDGNPTRNVPAPPQTDKGSVAAQNDAGAPPAAGATPATVQNASAQNTPVQNTSARNDGATPESRPASVQNDAGQVTDAKSATPQSDTAAIAGAALRASDRQATADANAQKSAQTSAQAFAPVQTPKADAKPAAPKSDIKAVLPPGDDAAANPQPADADAQAVASLPPAPSTDAKPAAFTHDPAALSVAALAQSSATDDPSSSSPTSSTSGDSQTQSADPQTAAAAQAPVKIDDKPASPKDDTALPSFAKSLAAGKTNAADHIKSQANASDAGPSATPQVEVPAETAKPAPQPMQGASEPVGGMPQAPQPSITPPIVTQHVQVTAQAAPNLPALAVEIAAKSQSGAKQFDIRLDPPELGRVDVRLSIDATGKASAHLTADQPQTLTLLQNDAPALTRALREAGLDVSQDGLNFSLRQQAENFNGNSGEDGRRGSARNFSLAATNEIDATTVTAAYRAAANGRLDIRV